MEKNKLITFTQLVKNSLKCPEMTIVDFKMLKKMSY